MGRSVLKLGSSQASQEGEGVRLEGVRLDHTTHCLIILPRR